MKQSAEGLVCEVSAASTGRAEPLVLGDGHLLPENEVAPAILLARVREYFAVFRQHMQHEESVAADLGLPDLDVMHREHMAALESFEMFITTCEDVDKKSPWTPRSLRQIFQCFLAHALEADLKGFAGHGALAGKP